MYLDKKINDLMIPLFQIKKFHQFVILSGGGGGQRVGLKNKVFIIDYSTQQIIQEIEQEFICDKIAVNEEENVLYIGSDEKLNVYYFNNKSYYKIDWLEKQIQLEGDLTHLENNDNYLVLVFDYNKLRVYSIDFEQQKTSVKFKGDLKEKIISLKIIVNSREVFISFKNGDLWVFNLQEYRFIDEIKNVFENHSKHFIGYLEQVDQLFTISSSQNLTTVKHIQKKQNKYVLNKQYKSNINIISSICELKDSLVIGNSEGILYRLIWNKYKQEIQLKDNIKVAELTLTGVLALPMQSYQQNQSIIAFAVSLDNKFAYIIMDQEKKQKYLKKNLQIMLTKFFFLIILFVAFIYYTKIK